MQLEKDLLLQTYETDLAEYQTVQNRIKEIITSLQKQESNFQREQLTQELKDLQQASAPVYPTIKLAQLNTKIRIAQQRARMKSTSVPTPASKSIRISGTITFVLIN